MCVINIRYNSASQQEVVYRQNTELIIRQREACTEYLCSVGTDWSVLRQNNVK